MKLCTLLRLIFSLFFCTNIAKAEDACMRSMLVSKDFRFPAVVLSGPAPVEKLPISLNKSVSLNTFRRAFNKGEFTEDEIYIKAHAKNKRKKLSENDAKIIQITGESVVVERVDLFGNFFTEILSQENLEQAKMNAAVRGFFKSLESTVKQVGPFQIPETHEEEDLKAKGWRDVFIVGLDDMNGIGSFGYKLRGSKMNPYTTHVVDFALQAPLHIEHIRRGIIEQGVEVEERLQILEQIWEEVQTKIREKKVSYAYWLYLHYRLSILATPSTEKYMLKRGDVWWVTEEDLFEHFNNPPSELSKNNKNLTELVEWLNDDINYWIHQSLFKQVRDVIHLFPSRIVIPTLNTQMGIKGMNRSISNEIFPATLVNKKHRYDDEDMTPFRAFTHDIEHALLSLQDIQRFTGSSMTLSQFYNAMENKILTIEQQERNETIFFSIGHELELLPMPQKRGEIRAALSLYWSSFYKKDDVGGLLPAHIRSKEQVDSYLMESIEFFSDTYDDIRGEFERGLH
ncbi:MAG: hypothetical protein OXK80_02860 [Bdellovibrionales bacterium]|nr:hypothetical protein [Bdellovibrionales bacterium]